MLIEPLTLPRIHRGHRLVEEKLERQSLAIEFQIDAREFTNGDFSTELGRAVARAQESFMEPHGFRPAMDDKFLDVESPEPVLFELASGEHDLPALLNRMGQHRRRADRPARESGRVPT